jgi:site-specific recombinase XerD
LIAYGNTTALIPSPAADIIERLKTLVLDSVNSPESKRAYARAIEDFLTWFQTNRPSTGFTKAIFQAYRAVLIESGLSSSTVNLRMTAIRRLAVEATDNGLMAPELASGIGRVKGMKRGGVRIGNWLTIHQAEKLVNTPNVSTLKGKRDRALLGVMIGCGLRREETASLMLERIQQREGRWVIVDMIGKGGRVRSIPMPFVCQGCSGCVDWGRWF